MIYNKKSYISGSLFTSRFFAFYLVSLKKKETQKTESKNLSWQWAPKGFPNWKQTESERGTEKNYVTKTEKTLNIKEEGAVRKNMWLVLFPAFI